ncbi:MAG: asparagine synthase (glutamine-hydrolyzing) [Elusimicrobia bacterium]|nr:asparagine synthase (glutamine-hydrolyzing) [Elusimicrobiota bacterium]
MCGVAGVFERSGARRVEEGGLRRMLAMLRHRGPDEFGMLLDREAGIANARLSIIDLSGGSQPISNEDETLWVVFNGEIFNYVELRAGLEAKGHRFRTSSDTEVIVHLFEERGPGCLSHLNGQFAIAIWDTKARRLFLGRDRLGVRPLFYTEAEGALLFASEIKSLLSDGRVRAELDPSVIEQVFTFWAPLASHTVFRGIREVPPGHFLVVDARSLEVKRWWSPSFKTAAVPAGARPRRFEEVVEEFRALLIDACRIRLRADVPVGAYLSGGLDSSTIASIVERHGGTKLSTFSIAFEDPRFDESAYQRSMAQALGTEHHVVHATHADIGRAFPEVVWHAEVPVMRTAPVPMFLLSKLVRDQGFKVVLTGEGADEFLAGYDIFKEAKVRGFWARRPDSKLRPLLLKRLYGDIPGLANLQPELLAAFFKDALGEVDSPFYSHAIRWRNSARARRFLLPSGRAGAADRHLQELAASLPADFHSWEPLGRAQYLEATIFLSQYLLSSQGDRMGMAHSIEGRFPFLDTRLVEFCNSLDPRLKLRGLREKHLLKAAARPWLPEAILRRVKRPYRAPIHRSFFGPHAPDFVDEVLSERALARAGLFEPGAVDRLLRKVREGDGIGETDDMALAGILSSQLLHRLFVEAFRASEPLSSKDRVRVCRIQEA